MSGTYTAPPGTTNPYGVDVSGKTFRNNPVTRTTAGRSSFATFLILCPTSFFLGILYAQFPYDYPILWTSTPPSPTPTSSNPFNTLETHLRLLHASPPLIPRILHIVIGTGLLGFLLKLFKPTESNLLFDGASLALYVIGIIVYLSNIVKGLRLATSGAYSAPGEHTTHGHPMYGELHGEGVGREDSLKVLSASHTILALILVGVLVLQAGQWYAERKERQEMDEQRRRAAEERERGRAGKASAAGGGGGRAEKKRQ